MLTAQSAFHRLHSLSCADLPVAEMFMLVFWVVMLCGLQVDTDVSEKYKLLSLTA
jgi:hypothetical protein